MSRWDELDKMTDRVEEGKRNLKNAKYEEVAPCEDVIKIWNDKIKEIESLIATGCLETEEWYVVTDSRWVEFKKGGFLKRSFFVSENIKIPAKRDTKKRNKKFVFDRYKKWL